MTLDEIHAVVAASVGALAIWVRWLFDRTRQDVQTTATAVRAVESRLSAVERAQAVSDGNFEHLRDTLGRVEKKLDSAMDRMPCLSPGHGCPSTTRERGG